MKKLLLSLAVAAMSFGYAAADEVTFDFINKDYGMTRLSGTTQEYNSNPQVITDGAVSITISGENGSRLWSDGLRLYKGATSIKFAVSGGTVDGIVFTAKANGGGKNIELAEGQPGTYTATDSSKESTWTGSAATVDFKSLVTSGNQAFGSIKVTYTVSGTAKKNANLAFSEKEVTITEGDAFTAPTLTKATNAEVVYSTSDENVADVNATTGAVTIMGVGEAVISAKAAENDEYYAGEASYKIIVKEKLAAGTVVLLDATAADGTEGWTLEANNLPEGLSYVWKWKVYNGSGYLNGSAYVGGSANTIDACYAISPAIDLTSYKSASFKYESAAKFQTTLKTLCGVAVREEGATEWTALEVTTWPEAGGWTWGWSNDFDLTPYVGKKIQIGYKYGSSSAGADTWEIRNLTITGETGGVDVVENFVDDNNAPVVYYNMQGMKVANPTEGMYIRVQGSKSTKVMIRK